HSKSLSNLFSRAFQKPIQLNQQKQTRLHRPLSKPFKSTPKSRPFYIKYSRRQAIIFSNAQMIDTSKPSSRRYCRNDPT
ncbi:MAG: hypothetical protein PHH11_14095, partial [Methylomonas sp.]|nr:hypothetical protein [Methylomonas sp.]